MGSVASLCVSSPEPQFERLASPHSSVDFSRPSSQAGHLTSKDGWPASDVLIHPRGGRPSLYLRVALSFIGQGVGFLFK